MLMIFNDFLLPLIHNCCWNMNHVLAEEPNQLGFWPLTFVSFLFWCMAVWRAYFVDVEKGPVSRGWKPWHTFPLSWQTWKISKHKLLIGWYLALNGDIWHWMKKESKKCALVQKVEGMGLFDHWIEWCHGDGIGCLLLIEHILDAKHQNFVITHLL